MTNAKDAGDLAGKIIEASYLNKRSQELYRKADALLGTLLAKLDCDQMLDNKSDPEREYKAATLFFLTKAVKSYRAIQVLCSAGFFQDAAVLSRTIFEIFLQVAYMSASPIERAPQFLKHALAEQYFLYLKLTKYPDLVSHIEKREADLHRLTAHFKELEGQYNKNKGWWGQNLRWLAEKVELDDNQAEKQYLHLYPLYSALVHSTFSASKHYILETDSRTAIDSGPSVSGKTLAAFPTATLSVLLTAHYAAAAWEIADSMMEALLLGKESPDLARHLKSK